jgi:hypothetical protein
MSSHEQPSRLNFTNTRGRGSCPRPDSGNRFYFKGSRGWGGGSAARPAYKFPFEPDLKEGLNTIKIIDTIPAPTRPTAPEDFPIKNVKYVASYNWIDAEKPTIVVPGSPAIWAGRDIPFTLQPDHSSVFVDKNSAWLSEHPMLPLFVAADAIHGHKAAPAPVDWPTVDVVTDRNGLRKLMRWLNPSPGREVRDFRIDVQLVGTKTLVLGRWEGRSREPPTGRTYGIGFENATTRPAPGCPSSGHERVITYDMLNMKMVVRFGVDACLPGPDSSVAAKSTDDSDPADAPSNVDIQPSATTMSAINIVRAGTQVPQDALVEVLSRSVYYLDQLDWNELYPQLVLSQTSALRLGVHDWGEFTELREWQLEGPAARVGMVTTLSGTQMGANVLDLSAQLRETSVQIEQLARVLQDVQKVAIARGAGPAGGFSLVCEDGKLRVYARKRHGHKKSLTGSCLPPEVVARFETRIDRDSDE